MARRRTRFEGGDGAFAPQGGEHFPVRGALGGGGLVLAVVVADGGALTDDREAGCPEGVVGVDEAGQPVVDGRGGLHVGLGQTAHEAHVEDRERRFHVVLGGVGRVEEGADGLLGQVVVVAGAQAHQVLLGDFGGEGDGELVPPLPGVGGEEVVVGRVEAEGGEGGGEAGAGLLGEFVADEGVVVEAGCRMVKVAWSRRAASQISRSGAAVSGA